MSHARVHEIHGRTELGIDTRLVPRVLGVPRFIFGSMVRNALGWLRALIRPNAAARAEHWLSLVYYAGYCREIWRPTTLGRETVQKLGPALLFGVAGPFVVFPVSAVRSQTGRV